MRKLALAIATMLFMAGLVVAAEVTLVKYDKDKKELTVKDGDKEKTLKITDKTKFSVAGKDGDKDLDYAAVEKMLSNEKYIGSGKAKWDVTTEGDTITSAKFKFGGKGKKDKDK